MDGDDSFFRFSGFNGTKNSDNKIYHSRVGSGSIISKRHRRKSSSSTFSNPRSYLVAKKQGKNSYQMTNA